MKSKFLIRLKQRLELLTNEKLWKFEIVFQLCSANLETIVCLKIGQKAKERLYQGCKARFQDKNLKVQITSYDQTCTVLDITTQTLTLAEKQHALPISLARRKILPDYQMLILRYQSLMQAYLEIIRVQSSVQTWSVYLQHLLQTYNLKQSDSEKLRRLEMLAMTLPCSVLFTKNQ